jgi:YidC/Oxa1 family membrane protein insertase
MFYSIYHTIVYQPFLNLLIIIYSNVSFADLGIAIILLTILIRLALFPLFQKSQRHQMIAQKIQPHLKKIQQDHAGNPQKQTEAMIALYKEHDFNPFIGFVLLLVQIPIMIALYHIFINLFEPNALSALYSFVPVPANINDSFLGLMSLKKPSIVIVVITAILQYVQGFLMRKHLVKSGGNQQAVAANTMIMFLGPVLTLTLFSSLPSAVTLYWLVSTVVNVIQQEIIYRNQ